MWVLAYANWQTREQSEMLQGIDGSRKRAGNNQRVLKMLAMQQRKLTARFAAVKELLKTPAGKADFIRHVVEEEKLYKQLCMDARAADNKHIMTHGMARYKAVKRDVDKTKANWPDLFQQALNSGGGAAASAGGAAEQAQAQAQAAVPKVSLPE